MLNNLTALRLTSKCPSDIFIVTLRNWLSGELDTLTGIYNTKKLDLSASLKL